MRSVRILATALASLLLLAASAAPAAAVDQTPPDLTVSVKPAFLVGTQVNPLPLSVGDPVEFPYTTDIAQRIEWSATDDVGVCSYDLFRVISGAPPEPVLEFSQLTEHVELATDYDGSFGGGSLLTTGFLVTARDCTGNATTKVVPMRPVVTQEDGSSAAPSAGTVSTSGAWGTTTCSCFLWGETARTFRKNASLVFTRTYEEGDHVAFVMATGPLRGRASIRIDGVWVGTVDTYAPVNTNRIVVFDRTMRAGTHTIAIVNQATPNRPRIDVDAIITN